MQVIKWVFIGLLVVVLGLLGYGFTVISGYQQTDDEVGMVRKEEYLRSIIGNPMRRQWPNIVLILFDDLGYGDIGAFGGRAIATPNMDQLAMGGTMYTEYHSPSSVCSPSRAGLLTGRYPPRAGLTQVLFPAGSAISNFQKLMGTNIRIPGEEILLPEILQIAGYNTGMVGKWHMGDVTPSLPRDRGFDYFYGALYSNDMEPFALYENDRIEVEAPADQTRLNERYTNAVLEFIDEQGDTPFFLYYAHSFPHEPLYSSTEQQGKSNAGLYGDVVEDIDNSIGSLIAALEVKGALENTLIILTSDNGPWYQGAPGDSRGRKNQTWQGGQRVPFIAHWPGRVRAGARDATPISGVDVVPTLLNVLNIDRPLDRRLDGRDISGALFGNRLPPERQIYFYNGDELEAVREGRFKYVARRGVRAGDFGDSLSFRVPHGPWLFDLSLDPSESYDVSGRHPEQMRRLESLFEAKNAEMAENPRGWLN